jgi:hypothetical protein
VPRGADVAARSRVARARSNHRARSIDRRVELRLARSIDASRFETIARSTVATTRVARVDATSRRLDASDASDGARASTSTSTRERARDARRRDAARARDATRDDDDDDDDGTR